MGDFHPANLRRTRWEYRSPASVNGIPVVHVALGGRDQGGGYRPGVARGIFAFGDIAIGPKAVGAVTPGLLLPTRRRALRRDSGAAG